MHALVVPVGSQWYAVEPTRVREVVTSPQVVSLPTAPSTLLGVFNLRGDIVPLFDTAALLGVGQFAEHPFAVVVDTPLGPAGLSATAEPQAHDGRSVVSLDVEALLAPVRIGRT